MAQERSHSTDMTGTTEGLYGSPGSVYLRKYGMTREQLQQLKESAGNQERVIARLFYANKGKLFTPSEVMNALSAFNWPITSIRRAINTLTEKIGVLEMTDETRRGPYGRNEHCWRWNVPKQSQGKQGTLFSEESKVYRY